MIFLYHNTHQLNKFKTLTINHENYGWDLILSYMAGLIDRFTFEHVKLTHDLTPSSLYTFDVCISYTAKMVS